MATKKRKMKRKRTDSDPVDDDDKFDPLDPKNYEPDLRLLFDCVRMNSGLVMPSQRFLAILAWCRNHPQDLMSMPHGDPPVVSAPDACPSDLWTEMVWVLANRRVLKVAPSGALLSMTVFTCHGAPFNRFDWTVRFRKVMGGDIERITSSYGIMPDHLHLSSRTVYFRKDPDQRANKSARHITADPKAALAKRKTWFAPNPRQIDPVESPPPMAQEILNWLWRWQADDDVWRNLREFTWHCLGGAHVVMPQLHGLEQEKYLRHFGAMVWLFVKGHIDIAAFRIDKRGPRVKSRPRRRRFPKGIPHSSQTVPVSMGKKLASVLCDSYAISHIISQKLAMLFDQ